MEVVRVAHWVNDFNGSTATESFTAASASTSGIAVPQNRKGKVIVARLRHAATGARTATVRLWGYIAGVVDSDGAAVASTAGWVDTEEDIILSSTSTDGSIAKVFESLGVFSDLHGQITAISGTSNTLGLDFGFTEEE
jgi:hypothetical protein